MKAYKEPSRKIPIKGNYDVIVAGGGTAGAVAAIASARTGAKTLVIERLDCLGGLLTAGMMSLSWGFNDMEKLIVKGIPLEIINHLKESQAVVENDLNREAFIIYDTEQCKSVFQAMAEAEPNLDVLYYTWISDVIVENGTVKGLITENKSGRQAVYAKCIIDATGDADIVAFSGASYKMAPPENAHPVTLLAKLGGVNISELKAYYEENPDFIGTFCDKWPYTPFHTYRLEKELSGKVLPEELEYLRDWFIIFHETIRDGEIMLNMTGDTAVDGTSAEEISAALDLSRARIQDCVSVLKSHIPGFQNSYLVTTGSTLGIRESRQLDGLFTVTLEDLVTAREYPDTVCRGSSLVGSHSADGKDSAFVTLNPGQSFSMPYRCMVPKTMKGLLVAGRCVSVEAKAMGGTRIMPVCMGLGQAAGVAAAICAKQNITPADIDTAVLRETLLEQGVYLG